MLARIFDKWASKKQRNELEAFVTNLKYMDGSEISMLIANATNIRHQILMKLYGGNPLDPCLTLVQDPYYTFKISKLIIHFQKEGRLIEAAGLMVWTHTFRAIDRLELRELGRQMWKELERGFSQVEQSAEDIFLVTKTGLSIEGYDKFPEGLTPNPL